MPFLCPHLQWFCKTKQKRISFKLGHSFELFTTLFRCIFSVQALTSCFTLSRFLSLWPRKYRSYNCPRQFFIQCGGSERLWISTGSGKTNTGIKLVYLFCKINRQLEAEGKGKKTVLYCGPSNKSVDLVASECPCCPNCHGEKGLATTMSSCVFSNSMMSSFSAQATS